MSITDAINNARQKINNVYNALAAKGATMPGTMNLDHMVTTVEAIPEFWQTINLFKGWGVAINEYGFVLTSGPNVASVTVPYVDGIYLGDIYNYNKDKENSALQSIDLQHVPFVMGNMSYAFCNCRNLTSVTNMNENVESLAFTFNGCSIFNQEIRIPNSVTNMVNTFSRCSSFNQEIQIPNSVTNMRGTFYGCSSFNQPINIPDSVVDLDSAFHDCGLNCDVSIGSSVENMGATFAWCSSFDNKNITIFSPNIYAVSTTFTAFSGSVNVYIPFKYENGVNSLTFDSFVSAGYLKANGAQNNTRIRVSNLNQLST